MSGFAGFSASSECRRGAARAAAETNEGGVSSNEAIGPGRHDQHTRGSPDEPRDARAAVTVEVSPGELLDKITILEIKVRRIADPAKLRNVEQELRVLEVARRVLPKSPALAELTAELRSVNETLWQIEDDIRRCERASDFGPRFVELARAVYQTNDRRAGLKRRINELLGARIVEEKSYAEHAAPASTPAGSPLDEARRLHRAGDLAGAERLYLDAVRAAPTDAQAWYLLGVLRATAGRPAEAVLALRAAAAHGPNHAAAHNHLGVALAAQGLYGEAAESFRRSLGIAPSSAEARHNLGLAFRGLGRLDEAAAEIAEALRLRPDFAEAHQSRGAVLASLGRAEEAEACFREALRLRPDLTKARRSLCQLLRDRDRLADVVAVCREAVRAAPRSAEAHADLGTALRRAGRGDEAVGSCREAARLAPGSPEAHNNLGLSLLDCDRLAEAEVAIREAVRLNPGFAAAHNNLGIVAWRGGRWAEARDRYEEALRLRPDFAEAVNNLGNTVRDLGQLGEAGRLFERAIGLNPDYADAHWNRALLWLLRGDFARGWPEYEWRWRLRAFTGRSIPGPRWDGEPLGGRTILLHAEQGLGDTFQFVRYAPLVKARGGTVVLRCQPSLVKVLAGAPGVDALAPENAPLPAFDVQAPLLSLPLIFRTSDDSIPAAVPHLSPDPARVARWGTRLAALPGLKVGIAWQGSGKNRTDAMRSVALAAFEPLARVPGVTLVSLQTGPGVEQVAALGGRFPVAVLDGLDADGPFLDTAAVIANLDLVVACDSAVGHLAGALGVGCWLALMFVPDWRWQLERADSPWYPRHRLFRQDRLGDWAGVFDRMAGALRRKPGLR
jgi:tetratricopeptide (TPR) repeat protein